MPRSLALRTSPLAGVASLALALLTLSAASPARAQPGKLSLTPCRLQGGLNASCGTFDVPEDRKHPAGRHLHLHVAVIPALAHAPKADPLYLLAGGPGQGALEALPPLIPAAFEAVHRTRELVLVDQRGTGKSNPLRCELVKPDAPLEVRLSDQGYTPAALGACLKSYDADPRLYTTSIAMQDLDEVRAALGHEQINLWGGSYGTRASLVYLREHGEHVRAVILDGVAPPELRLPLYFAQDAERAMLLLFRACAEEPACGKAFPDLPGRFRRLVERLGEKPQKVTVADPLSGAPVEVTVSRNLFTGVLRGVLYQPWQAALVPLVIARAEAGDFGPLVALGSVWSKAIAESMAVGMMFSVLCAEDVPRFNDADVEQDTKDTFLGKGSVQMFQDACKSWPRGEVPAGYGEPVKSDKPVLLLSGELDPVTPPSWAQVAARTLPHSLQLVVPGVGHGASGIGCVPRLMSQFLDQGSEAGLDGACVQRQKRPPFFVSFAGPTP